MKNTALVTGASSGIGLELARIFAREGYDLVVTARSESALLDLQKELQQKYKNNVVVLPLDLSLPGSAQKIFQATKERNIIVEVLVNNAGFGTHGFFAKSDWRKQQQMIDLNISSLTELTYLFVPGMQARRSGKILNVASTAAFQAGPLMSVYYATKAYVLSFSEALAEELSADNITVTALCPGPTISGFQSAAGIGNIPMPAMLKIPSSRDVAEYGYRALMCGRVIAVQGLLNRIAVFFVKLVPRSWARKAARKVMEAKL